MLLMLMMSALGAGGTSLTANYPLSFHTFLIPAIGPLFLRLLMEPDRIHIALAGLTIFMSLAGVALVRETGESLRNALELRFRNAILVRDLLWAQEQMTTLNASLESRIAARTAELKSALSVRDEFLRVASHELKTPLTALSLQVEILEQELAQGGLRERIRMAGRATRLKRQVDRLGALVKALLDVSLLETGKLELKPQVINVAHIIGAVAVGIGEDLRRRGVQFDVDLDSSVVGEWDPVRLEQIVTNLLTNAAKFGRGKPISIALHRVGSATARLTVQDHGMGMSSEDLARVFGKYERAVPVSHYGGMGLGLFIVQQLVHAMNGRIEMESTPGEGTTVRVYLALSLAVKT
jgi:signal transduction histidine kinase